MVEGEEDGEGEGGDLENWRAPTGDADVSIGSPNRSAGDVSIGSPYPTAGDVAQSFTSYVEDCMAGHATGDEDGPQANHSYVYTHHHSSCVYTPL
jgi:hypothetical protein